MTKWMFGSTALGLCLLAGTSWGFNLIEPQELEGKDPKQVLKIPYAFYSDLSDTTYAFMVGETGHFQPQMSTLLNVFYSSNDSRAVYLYGKDTQLNFLDERLFLDTKLIRGEWGLIKTYSNGNPDFPGEEAGDNDSDEDNFIENTGTDSYYRLNFRYLLPIGHGRDKPIHTFKTRGGLLVSGYEAGGVGWNPLETGRTTLEFEPFYRIQDVEDDFGVDRELKTSGVEFRLDYDNTDFFQNPSQGNRQLLTIGRDWGALDGAAPWTKIEFEYSHYWSLPLTNSARQRVVAFNLWTVDVPTWNSSHTENGQEVFHRAPPFAGATLGGPERFRGYATARFNDRAAINYTVEYRYIPTWNPLPDLPVFNWFHIPWWQWVGFAEYGRVAPSYSVSELHKDMRWNLGGGVRALVNGLLVRLDVAASEEGSQVQMFVGQPF